MSKFKRICVKIGIFDSGIGGLSILEEVLKNAKNLELYYLADAAFCPYGQKSTSEIQNRCDKIVRHFVKIGVELVIVACNSATTQAIEHLRNLYEIPFVGVEPFVTRSKKNERSLLIATKATCESSRLKHLLALKDKYKKIDVLPTPALAPAIEDIIFESSIKELKKAMVSDLQNVTSSDYDTVILGCTHYVFIREKIETYLGIKSISPCSFVAKRIFEIIDNKFYSNCEKLDPREVLFNYTRLTDTLLLEKMKKQDYNSISLNELIYNKINIKG